MLSIVIITLNEEKNLLRLLPEIQVLSDDIVVVDSGSSDGTEEVCSKYGARFHSIEWNGYSHAKNFGNERAKHTWILSLDADEVPDAELLTSLSTHIPVENTLYEVRRLTNFCGKWINHSGWNPEWRGRIFEKDFCRWEGEFVHEKLSIPDGWRVERLPGLLLHFSYTSLDDFEERCVRYADLSAQELIANGESVPSIVQLLSPTFRFLKAWVLKRGFLDGRVGWIISRGLGRMVRRKYQTYRRLKKDQQ